VIATTGAIKGAEVGFSNSAHHLGVSRDRYSEREEDSSKLKKMFLVGAPLRRDPPPP